MDGVLVVAHIEREALLVMLPEHPSVAGVEATEADVRWDVEHGFHPQQAIAEQVSRYLNSSTRNLEFQVDSEAGTAVIVVRDVQGNVIRRIPGEEALQRMLRASAESGTLIDSTA